MTPRFGTEKKTGYMSSEVRSEEKCVYVQGRDQVGDSKSVSQS